MRVHGMTHRQPLVHFREVELAHLLAVPSGRYDVPVIAHPKDSKGVRISQRGRLLREHPRRGPGGRSTVAEDLPQHKRAYAMRDIDYLKKKAAAQGEHIGIYADRLLDGELPWTQMRRVYKLLSLSRRFGAEAVETACRRTLELDVLDVTKGPGHRRGCATGREAIAAPGSHPASSLRSRPRHLPGHPGR